VGKRDREASPLTTSKGGRMDSYPSSHSYEDKLFRQIFSSLPKGLPDDVSFLANLAEKHPF
jgi:hypothetical protein